MINRQFDNSISELFFGKDEEFNILKYQNL